MPVWPAPPSSQRCPASLATLLQALHMLQEELESARAARARSDAALAATQQQLRRLQVEPGCGCWQVQRAWWVLPPRMSCFPLSITPQALLGPALFFYLLPTQAETKLYRESNAGRARKRS